MYRYGWLLIWALGWPSVGLPQEPPAVAVVERDQGGRTPSATAEPVPHVPAPNEVIAWEPPDLGAPAHRSGGGTRGVCQLCAFAPRDTALTATPTPRLYWYLEPGFRNSLKFFLQEEGAERPLLEALLPPTLEGGIGMIDLAEQGVSLKEGRVYHWQVEMVPDAHQRWLRFSAGGRILYRKPAPASLSRQLPKRLFQLAKSGYWYDAVDILTRLIEGSGDAPGWLRQRAALLEQGGQHMLAQLDLELAGTPMASNRVKRP